MKTKDGQAGRKGRMAQHGWSLAVRLQCSPGGGEGGRAGGRAVDSSRAGYGQAEAYGRGMKEGVLPSHCNTFSITF